MNKETKSLVVDFPLRGEWVAGHTPAERIPSHGTDLLGQRFAYDFLRIENRKQGWKFFSPSFTVYFLIGVRLEECYGWSEPIYAPFGGTVVSAEDGWPERKRLHFLKDLAVVFKNAFIFNSIKETDLRPILGNHIILKMDDNEVYAFFAHARCGSLQVHKGDNVQLGQHLANVGHSGNSTAPHLHFHLMDKANILEAQGLPCRFREYQALHNGTWGVVIDGIPGKREFIRYTV